MQPSEQAQFGWYPALTSAKFNIFPQRNSVEVMGTIHETKPKGYGDVQINVIWAVSQQLNPGEVIEVQVMVGAHESGQTPATFWKLARTIQPGATPMVFSPMPFWFPGFDKTQEQLMTIMTIRKCQPIYGVDSAAELWVQRTSVRFPNSGFIPTTRGMGF